jgi:tRNA nucleotidyltransferase (CCA-adding enzyme)
MRKISDDVACLWAALCHDVGKGLTPIALLPKHPNHEVNGVVLVKILSERYKIPSLVQELAMLACRWHGDIHKAQELSAEQRLAVFDACDAWRKPERFMQILLICQADSQGRLGFESELYAQFSVWQAWLIMLSKISAQDFIARGLQGSAIKQAIVEQRLLCLTD